MCFGPLQPLAQTNRRRQRVYDGGQKIRLRNYKWFWYNLQYKFLIVQKK
jgi:hypothetical protein